MTKDTENPSQGGAKLNYFSALASTKGLILVGGGWGVRVGDRHNQPGRKADTGRGREFSKELLSQYTVFADGNLTI